jgi:hypothetical protein
MAYTLRMFQLGVHLGKDHKSDKAMRHVLTVIVSHIDWVNFILHDAIKNA